MSAQPAESTLEAHGPEDDQSLVTEAPAEVEVRRNAVVSALVGVASSAIAIAYLGRAAENGSPVDWALCAALSVIAVVFFRGLLDARLPLMVADEMGVRLRLGRQWRGLPWEAIDSVVVTPRRGWWHDGRLVVSVHHLNRAVEGLDGRARRHAALNQKVYGAVLAVPLGVTTRLSGAGSQQLADRVATLSQGRAEVVTLLDEPGPVVPAADVAGADEPAEGERRVLVDPDVPAAPDRRPRWLRREEQRRAADPERAETTGQARVATRERDLGIEDEPVVAEPVREGVSLVADALNPVAAPADPRQAGKVRAIARLGEPVAPLVIGEFQPEPAYDPVIGPELAAARTRVGLSVDELADRTRIRPHVIESIEVDDFTPCGGDFYARGHIRTLARVLGKDAGPLLAHFESRYATAPVTARRVFEAELATGMTGSIRSTRVTGPNWAVLVGVVLCLVLVWSLVRLVAGTSPETLQTPPPLLNGSAGLSGTAGGFGRSSAPPPVTTTLTAANGGASVEVRNGRGDLVYSGDLVLGESATVRVRPPVTVTSDDGAAVTVSLGGVDQGTLGEAGQTATKVFQRPSS